ncbi:hypothetical protein C5N99_09200 [Treponema medium]|uniref:InlB B-repeat-containing protein n=1 Tax=Treponema medium TaxID=58231 RepID=UPI0019813AAB|nr:hypothetical protein [Treponema medium]QSH92765.1 hypothetical protein C5N99_09200 [Treponema medium]
MKRTFTSLLRALVLLISAVVMAGCPQGNQNNKPDVKSQAYKVTLTKSDHGTVTAVPALPTDGMVAKDTLITFTAKPDEDFVVDRWTLSTGGFEAGTGTDSSAVAKIKVTAAVTVTVNFKSKPEGTVKYTVEHWQQNITGTDYTKVAEEIKYGKPGENTQAEAQTYEDFNAKLPIVQHIIDGNSTTIVQVYYDRKELNNTNPELDESERKVLIEEAKIIILEAEYRLNTYWSGLTDEVRNQCQHIMTEIARHKWQLESIVRETNPATAEIRTSIGNLKQKIAEFDAALKDNQTYQTALAIEKAKTQLDIARLKIEKTQLELANIKFAEEKSGKTIDASLKNAVTAAVTALQNATEDLNKAVTASKPQQSEVENKMAVLRDKIAELTVAIKPLQIAIADLGKEFLAGVPVFVKEDGVTVETKNGESITYTDLKVLKNLYPDTTLNTENVAVHVDALTPALVNDFFKNFTHLNIDISKEVQVTSNDTQDPDADGNVQYFKAADLSEVSDRINFVDNSSGSMNPFKTFQFENIKGNIVIADTFSGFDGRELEAFVTDSYTLYNGTVIPRTKTWVTFSQLTKLIRWLKKYEFFNNKVRFGDMLVVNKRDGDQGVLNCLNTMINENIERFELKNTPGEEYSIKFAGTKSIPCYFILNGYPKKSEINVEQLLQISKRCRGEMSLRFNIKNLNCKKLSPDDLKDLTFEGAWFSGHFEGEDTDLSEISFKGATSAAAGVVSFTGVLPKDQSGASHSYLIIRDAEIPNFDVQDGYIDWDNEEPIIREARKGMACLPSNIGNLIVHNLKGLDKICKGLNKKEVSNLHLQKKFDFYCFLNIDSALYIGNGVTIGSYVGDEEVYKEFNRLCAFRVSGYWSNEPNNMFVCFTDRNNNVFKGPYKRMQDEFKKNTQGKWEYIENAELTPVPLGNYKQDEDGFFEEK